MIHMYRAWIMLNYSSQAPYAKSHNLWRGPFWQVHINLSWHKNVAFRWLLTIQSFLCTFVWVNNDLWQQCALSNFVMSIYIYHASHSIHTPMHQLDKLLFNSSTTHPWKSVSPRARVNKKKGSASSVRRTNNSCVQICTKFQFLLVIYKLEYLFVHRSSRYVE